MTLITFCVANMRTQQSTVKSDMHEYHDAYLSNMPDGWEEWTKTAYEAGNGQVFLKFASWMLVRFRQVTGIDMDEPVNGVIIPENPRLRETTPDDHFFEALGMERLYSAIVHLEAAPRYMCHLLHALGKVIDQSDVAASNPTVHPCKSPPTVTAPYVPMPWMNRC